MGRKISCGDVVPGCRFEAEAATEQELLQKVAEHAAQAHGLSEITPAIAEKARAAVRET